MKISELRLNGNKPCRSAMKWRRKHRNKTPRELWDICHDGGWMWWALRAMGLATKKLSVAFARDCASAYAYAAYADAAAAAAYAAAAVDAAAAWANAYADAYAGDAAAAYAKERLRQANWLRANVKLPKGL